jgi:hypothetical protein
VLLGAFAADLATHVMLTSFDGDRMDEAIDVARRYGLRAPDAMRFAAAVHADRRLKGGEFVLVTSDEELLAATRSVGMTVLNPETEHAIDELRALRRREANES